MDSHKRKHEKQERGDVPSSVSPNREAGQHQIGLVAPPTSISLPSTSPGAQGLPHNNAAIYLSSAMGTEYPDHPRSALNLDGSLNLGTDVSSSLFFLKNASGLGLSDSLDLSKKLQQREAMFPMGPRASMPASMSLSNPQDDTTGTSGEPEDELSPDEEPTHEDEDDEDDEDEPEEDLNTDSYDDSMPEPDGEKDTEECFDASMNHTEASQLEKDKSEADL